MPSVETQTVVERAKRLYGERLRSELEQRHLGRFVAIEPVSGENFLADTLDEAVAAARARHPHRVSHTVRIGQATALHLGLLQS